MNDHIEKLLAQTRPAMKGNRFRGKSNKSRKRVKTNTRKEGNGFSRFIDPGALFGLGGLASSLGAQKAEIHAAYMMARAQADSQTAQAHFLRQQQAQQGLGTLGGGIGQAAAGQAMAGLF